MCKLVSLLTMMAASAATAQLTPDRLYCAVDRAIPMTIARPAGASGDLAVVLVKPVSLVVFGSAPGAEGAINLATMFPQLWTDKPREVLYAQLLIGQNPVGAPVVLQPMVPPRNAVLVSKTSNQAFWIDAAGKKNIDPLDSEIRYFNESPPAYAGVRAYTDKRVVFETTLGEIEFAMRPDAAPNTVFNFLHLCENGFYTDIPFHRVVPISRGHPFVIQVGDPTGTGDGTPGYAIPFEGSQLPHDFGVISMARDTDPNTNGSQVFVCLSREGTARLDGRYTAFGTTVRGHDTIRAIAAVPLVPGEKSDRPVNPPVLQRARVIDAPPIKPATAAGGATELKR